MDTLFNSVATIQLKLREASIESVAIGGLAVAAWGEVRATQDVDLRVLLDRDGAERLLVALGTDYVPFGLDIPPIEALRQFGMLFVRDASGTRIDLLLSDIDFDREAVRRGRDVEVVPSCTIRICTAEDLLIYKVLAGRPKDLIDVPGVIEKQGGSLDVNYVVRWLELFETMIDDSTLVDTFRGFLH